MSIRVVPLLGMACLLTGAAVAAGEAAPAASRPPAGSMASMVEGLATAFGAGFAQPDAVASRTAFAEALAKLADGSEQLLLHGSAMGKSSEGLRVAIARDANDARAELEAGRYDDARRRVHQLVDHCFACHTNQAQASPSGLGEAMARSVDLSQLELREQVYFLVATRQFEPALSRIEAALRSPQAPQRNSWLFEAYLKLAIRADGSYARARAALEQFLAVADPAPYLDSRIRLWIASLAELEAGGALKDNLATARELIDRGRAMNEFPADKRGLVPLVAASGVLLRYLDALDGDARGQAEAYYLLGLTESHVSTTLWNDQTGFFLETAIRLRPHSPLAEKAFAFLREYEIFRNSGASSTEIPDSVQRQLDELAVLASRP